MIFWSVEHLWRHKNIFFLKQSSSIVPSMICENDACLKNLRIVQQLLVNISSGIQFLIKHPRKKFMTFFFVLVQILFWQVQLMWQNKSSTPVSPLKPFKFNDPISIPTKIQLNWLSYLTTLFLLEFSFQ